MAEEVLNNEPIEGQSRIWSHRH